MEILLTIIHTLICVFLMLAVLLQAGKGGGLAGAIGGGLGANAVLGGRSASTFLTKATAILATVFMLSCLVQSFTHQGAEIDTSTATERMLQEGELPVVPPPLSETPGFLEQETPAATGEAGGTEEGVE